MRSRKCPECSSFYPLNKLFSRCPACSCLTNPSVHAPEMSMEQGKALINQYRFERYYARHDGRKKLEGLPSPEQLGKQQAQEELELDRRLAA